MVDNTQYCDGCEGPLVAGKEWHYEGGDIRCDACVEAERDAWMERSIS